MHVTDRETKDWYARGHNGDRTVVCALCYQGVDLAGGPRQVALVLKGRRGGTRRQHFAHPPGMAPPGGQHSPETLWHATAKHLLQQWAVGRDATARIEACTPDRRRRSDVAITLPGGEQVPAVAVAGSLGEPTDGDEGGGEIEVEVDDLAVAFGAAPQLFIHELVRSITHPAACLDGRGHALAGDVAVEPEPGEQFTGEG